MPFRGLIPNNTFEYYFLVVTDTAEVGDWIVKLPNSLIQDSLLGKQARQRNCYGRNNNIAIRQLGLFTEMAWQN